MRRRGFQFHSESLWYYVRYKGYDSSHDQWVKHSDVFAPALVAEFYRKYPAKPRTISAADFDSLPFRDPTAHVRSLRRGAAFQGGGDVRGTPIYRSSRPTGSPTGSSGFRSPWHQACDQARDLCRSLRSSRRGPLPSPVRPVVPVT
ncbi:hypothetical protein B0H10DRAFT_2380372 [Mycena sp. CBHHK59/15]|nr:hypothetical protein B0H10DRAFT_2380372 [Mycena sp. CBHHK59/15]